MELLFGIQHINEIMGDVVHLFFRDLGGTDIHMAVYLHGIRGDDLPANSVSQPDRQVGLAHRRRSGQYDQRFFQAIHLHNPFEFLFQFVFCHGDNGGSSMRAVIRIFQSQKLVD